MSTTEATTVETPAAEEQFGMDSWRKGSFPDPVCTPPAEPAREGQVFAALIQVMRAMPAIGKDQVNQHFRYAFRGIDDIYNHLHPLLAEAGLVMIPQVLSHRQEATQTAKGAPSTRTVVTVCWRVMAADGSVMTLGPMVGEADKGDDKGTSAALSMAMKYLLFQLFCIPTNEAPDTEFDQRPAEEQRPQRQRETRPAAPARRAEGATAQRPAEPGPLGDEKARRQLAGACKAAYPQWPENKAQIALWASADRTTDFEQLTAAEASSAAKRVRDTLAEQAEQRKLQEKIDGAGPRPGSNVRGD